MEAVSMARELLALQRLVGKMYAEELWWFIKGSVAKWRLRF